MDLAFRVDSNCSKRYVSSPCPYWLHRDFDAQRNMIASTDSLTRNPGVEVFRTNGFSKPSDNWMGVWCIQDEDVIWVNSWWLGSLGVLKIRADGT